MAHPLLSVCLITYQHARFVSKAIEGALAQKTDFPFEILVGEDESSDGTREVCQDYAHRYPEKIRVFLRSRKDAVLIDGRPRGSFNFRMTLREAHGEFIALCEGDDYWTDPKKLQSQVDYLRANTDCAGCFHDVRLVDQNGDTIQKSYFDSPKDKFSQHDIIDSLLSRQPTCSMVFRRSAFAEPLPEWYLRRPSDLYLDILLTFSGKLGFIRRNMGAYRKHVGGIWSGQREASQILELIVRFKLLLADPFFLQNYKDVLLRKIDEFQASLFTRNDTAAEIDRLDKIVAEQTAALKATTEDRDRLQSESVTAATQRDHIAKTTAEQTAYIKTLESERDSLQQASALSVAESKRHLKSLATQESFIAQLKSQHAEHDRTLASLKDQLDKLAATAHEQTAYIASLEKQRDQLDSEIRAAAETATRHEKNSRALTPQLAPLTEIAEKQAAYIASLESERESLRQDHSHVLAESQRHLASLSEQDNFISLLKKQQTDQDALIASLRDQLSKLGQTAAEQTAYIESLKAQCEQAIRKHATTQQQAAADKATAAAERDKLQTQLEKSSALAATQEQRIASLLGQLQAQEQTAQRLRSLAHSRLSLLKKAHARQASHTQHLLDTLSNQHRISPIALPGSS
ncbi:hypothetical protein CMV30_12650 [Nibricoccus aquaticus]|uniref:Glycosyltransferase 2-like domain-containing protein n=1 Tax=Nibricoccus aquaticus TaxID=2576891 RepID=A0A290QL98_9BACT|nr:glycosyltransferase [Nibricoccus aquaticus]ATC64742.1 hypothetical protein CMV30_12650 [Nibricoccus aquaticus]